MLRSGPDQEAEAITIPLTTTRPLAAGPHQLAVTVGPAPASARWVGSGNWTQTITLDTAVRAGG